MWTVRPAAGGCACRRSPAGAGRRRVPGDLWRSFGPSSVGDDPAVAEVDPSRAGARDGGVVRDDEQGHAVGVQLPQQREDLRAVGAVEVAGGLVGEDQRRPADQGTGDGDALAFAAGQFAGRMAGAVREADAVQGLAPPRGDVLWRVPRGRAGRWPRCPLRTVVPSGRTAGTPRPARTPAGRTVAGRRGLRRPARRGVPSRWSAGPGRRRG